MGRISGPILLGDDMPSKAKKMCKHPGCNQLVDGAWCDKHKKITRSYDDRRGSAASRGYDARWRVARARWLSCYPLCVLCEAEGRLTRATVVDHITPHKGDYGLFWDASNWQSLCKEHHDSKTASEDGGFGRRG